MAGHYIFFILMDVKIFNIIIGLAFFITEIIIIKFSFLNIFPIKV